MIVKALNSYRIIHKNGTIETINAVNASVALENMTVTEEESPVINMSMLSSDIRTVIEEETYPDDTEPEAPEDTGDNTDIGGDVPLPDITDDTEDRG